MRNQLISQQVRENLMHTTVTEIGEGDNEGNWNNIVVLHTHFDRGQDTECIRRHISNEMRGANECDRSTLGSSLMGSNRIVMSAFVFLMSNTLSRNVILNSSVWCGQPRRRSGVIIQMVVLLKSIGC